MTTVATHAHTVVGIFHSSLHAYLAMRRLDSEGVPPRDVGLVSEDPELAGEVGSHSYAILGALAGVVLGLVLAAVYVGFSGPNFRINPVGIAIGTAFVAGGMGFIGFVFGRALLRRASRWSDYEHVVRDGGAIVTVACVPGECERAKEVLAASGADEIVDEVYADRV
jgi:hypothetical protein